MHAAVLRYAREVAFATAEVYARAAEVRGAWDARLEALVVDAVLRGEADEAVLSRASALGWAGRGGVAVVLGAVPARAHRDRRLRRGTPRGARGGHGRAVRRAGRPAGGGPRRRRRTPTRPPTWSPTSSATGPVVVGPGGRRPRARRHVSARAALSGAPRRRRAGRTRRDRCAATTCCPSGRWPATATPAGTWSTRSTCRCCRRPRHAVETLTAYFDARRVDRGAPRGPCSCTPTRCATGCGRSPTSPGFTPTDRATRSRCSSPWSSAGRPAATAAPRDL